MNNFERQVVGALPLHEAADFFVSIKQAAWTEDPDENGDLEGRFASPVDDVINKLSEVIAIRFRKHMAYSTYAQSFRSNAWRGIKDEFTDHLKDEQKALEFYIKRYTAIRGPVRFPPVEPPPPSTNPLEIIRILRRAEQESIKAQRELRDLVGDNNPMKVGIEECLLSDQHHLDELTQLSPGDTQVAKYAGAASDLMDQLAAGGAMPKGKAGYFKPVDQIKEAKVDVKGAGKVLDRAADLLAGGSINQQMPRIKVLRQNLKDATSRNTSRDVYGEVRKAKEDLSEGMRPLNKERVKVWGARGAVAAPLVGAGVKALSKKDDAASADQTKEASIGKALGRGVEVLSGKAGKRARAASERMYARAGEDQTPLRSVLRNAKAGVKADRIKADEDILTARARLGVGLGTLAGGAGVATALSKKDDAAPVDQTKASAANMQKAAGTLADLEKDTTRHLQGVHRDAGIARGTVRGGVAGAGVGALAGALTGGRLGAAKGALYGGGANALLGGVVGGMRGSHTGVAAGRHVNALRQQDLSKSMLLRSQVDPEYTKTLHPVLAARVEASRQLQQQRMQKAAAAMKIAFGMDAGGAGGMQGSMPNEQGGQPTAAAQGAPGQPAPEAAPPPQPVQDIDAAKSMAPPTVPVNYMGAEMVARAAQEANEVGFLRERLNAATDQNNGMKQELDQAQQQLQQLQQQSQQVGDQVMQATQEAVASSERALQNSMQAANMRIGINKMREAMMQVASQEPESMGTLAQQEQVQQEQQQQQAVNGQAGAPGQSPSPETAPGAAAAGAPEAGPPGPESGGTGESGNASGGSAAPQISIKTGAAMPPGMLPGAVAGAGLAALHGYRRSAGVEQKQQEVAKAEEAAAGGGFGKALDLAKAKQELAQNELHAKHPVMSNVKNVLGGAIGGAAAGAAAGKFVQALKLL